MRKVFGLEEYKFYLYDITTSVIFNDEIIKNKILNELSRNGYYVIDSKIVNQNITVSEFLKINGFNMKLTPYFKLENLMSKKINSINFNEKIFLKTIVLITALNNNIVLDDVLTFLDNNQKYLILKYLRDNNKIFINFTSDIEEVLYSKYLIALNSKGVFIEGNTKTVLKEEKIIKKNGFNLPFSVDLSLQLIAYDILDKEIYNLDRLVTELWK